MGTVRRLPWRGRRYIAAVPNSGQVRAFSTEKSALKWASRMRRLGWSTEVWHIRPLPPR